MTRPATRRHALVAFAALVLPTFTKAQDGSAAGDPLTVELSGVALPVVRNNVHVNYVFGVINIKFVDSASTFFLRENSHLLRDAIVRIASRTPIPEGPTPRSFDRVAVTRVVLQSIQAVRPGTRVVRVTLLDAAFMRN